MALTEDDLAEIRQRLSEIRAESEKFTKTLPELIEMQDLLMEELNSLYEAMSEIYGYAISYENDAKEMNKRLEDILKVASKTLGLQSFKDFKE